MRELRVVSLFSGIGGLDLGLERAGMRVVFQCEQDAFCRAVLRKHWPDVPQHDDVRTLDAGQLPACDVVCGGFPCQDISVAGKGAGIDGERSGLWKEMSRVIASIRPLWVVTENSPALRTRGYDRVAGDLEGIGYELCPVVVGADDLGAPQRRKRVFIVANAAGERGQPALREQRERDADADRAGHEPGAMVCRESARLERHGADAGQPQQPEPWDNGAQVGDAEPVGRRSRRRVAGDKTGAGRGRGELACAGVLGDAERDGRGLDEPGRGPQGRTPARWPSAPGCEQHEWEASRIVELPVGAATDGVPVRLVRFANRNALRAAGNAVVPQVAELIGRAVVAVDMELQHEA